MKRTFKDHNFWGSSNNLGLSMIEAMMGIGLIGVVGVAWLRYFDGFVDQYKNSKVKQEVSSIEHYLLAFPNCNQTAMDPSYDSKCLANQGTNILDAYGSVVVPATGKSFGNINVTNTCNNGVINFTAAVPGSGSPVPLHGGIPLRCRPVGCQWRLPESRLTVDGTLEYLIDGKKPGIVGQDSSVDGMSWDNSGGTDKPYGTAPATFDVGLCPKVGYIERAHKLTRTIFFTTPSTDKTFTIKIHRARYISGDSYGVAVWYHFEPRVDSLTSSTPYASIVYNSLIPSYKMVFNVHGDYTLGCNYTVATNRYSCSVSYSALTLNNCSPYQGPCSNFPP